MPLITDVQPHFLGFVSAQMQDTIVKSFHLNSFVLYYPNAEVVDEDVAYLTVVILMHTSRIHILSNMSDCLLHFIQLIRFCKSNVFTTTITNKFIGKEATIDQVSIDGYSLMGFNVQSLTQAVVKGEFNVVTNNPIPLIEYGDSYSWAKYGHHICHRGIIPIGGLVESMAKHDSNLTATHQDTLIHFLGFIQMKQHPIFLTKRARKKFMGFLMEFSKITREWRRVTHSTSILIMILITLVERFLTVLLGQPKFLFPFSLTYSTIASKRSPT
jgi:hypothetical protein